MVSRYQIARRHITSDSGIIHRHFSTIFKLHITKHAGWRCRRKFGSMPANVKCSVTRTYKYHKYNSRFPEADVTIVVH
jgi:hypothetical protein